MCLNIGVTIITSTTEMKIVLYYQCTVGAPVWSARVSMDLRIKLVLLAALYMNLIYP